MPHEDKPSRTTPQRGAARAPETEMALLDEVARLTPGQAKKLGLPGPAGRRPSERATADPPPDETRVRP